MCERSWIFLLLTLLLLGAPRAMSDDRAQRTLKGWGEVVDPDGDCQVDAEDQTLKITIPGKKHNLSVEAGDLNSPRVLANVDGDFIAQVKVTGNVTHKGAPTSNRFAPFHGAGLLLWQDERTYVRLERAAVVTPNGMPIHYATFEFRKDGRQVRTRDFQAKIPDQDTYLRLECRNGRVHGAVSTDNTHWQYFDPATLDFAQGRKLGVSASNTSTEPLNAKFSEFEIFRKPGM